MGDDGDWHMRRGSATESDKINSSKKRTSEGWKGSQTENEKRGKGETGEMGETGQIGWKEKLNTRGMAVMGVGVNQDSPAKYLEVKQVRKFSREDDKQTHEYLKRKNLSSPQREKYLLEARY